MYLQPTISIPRKNSGHVHLILQLVRQKILDKHRLWKSYMRSRDPTVFKQYKSAQNAVRKDFKKLQRNINYRSQNSEKRTLKSSGNISISDIMDDLISSLSSSLSLSWCGLLRRSRVTSPDSICPHVSGWTVVVVADLVQPSFVTWTTFPVP